ncbi:MAG: hypothetical protein K0U79_14950 [Gammaproteobacteria bacterium]|nr:hypothetical protein [Gammaproteobacteria bacterium]
MSKVETPNLVLEHLRYIRSVVDRTDATVSELRVRVGHLEEQYASMSRRIDRIDERVDRIERRLDLVDTE